MPVNEAIVLDLSSGLTKAETDITKPDTPTESYVRHIDVLIFDDNAGFPDDLKHYDRYVVNNAQQLTLTAKRTSFVANQPYHVYLVANSNLSKSEFEAVEAYEKFVDMKQTDELLHLTGLQVQGAPEYFLMDAKATDAKGGTNTKVVLYDNDPTENTRLYANLRRAAAKVVVNIKAGDDVTFADYDLTEDGKPISDGGLYYIQNLPYQAFLLAEARADDTIDSDVVAVRNTAWGYDGHFKWTPETDPKNASLVTYVYPNSWSTDIIKRETCVVVNLPMLYTVEGAEPVEYHNSWYKIHMTGEKVFRRNNYYEVNVTVNRPGASSETIPIDIENVYYAVEPWEEQSINVGGVDRPKYLSVNKTSIEMHNVATDASTLEFASSSPVTIKVSDVYYYNKFGQKTSVGNDILSAINGQTDGGIAGNITVNSPVPENNAIRYFTLTVTNGEGLSRTVQVIQYPLEYITNQQGWYSYRSDFYNTSNPQPTTYENRGSRRVAADWSNNGWAYSTSAENNYFFGSKVSSMKSNGTSTLYYYYWGQNSTKASTTTGNLTALNNARMYHVQITASSGKYTVGIPKQDADGFTDSGADNAKLVSPSFMIASQLGATQPPNSLDQARKHCREYVEVHDPDNNSATDNAIHYDNWRLPTAAEIQIIIDFQYVPNAAMDEVLSGKSYWSATGTVSNPGSTQSNSSQSAVRCIRDVY